MPDLPARKTPYAQKYPLSVFLHTTIDLPESFGTDPDTQSIQTPWFTYGLTVAEQDRRLTLDRSYRNWHLIARFEGRKMHVMLRTILMAFYVLPLFEAIRQRAVEYDVKVRWHPAALWAVFFGAYLTQRLKGIFEWTFLLGFIPLAIAQITCNRIISVQYPSVKASNRIGLVEGYFLLMGATLLYFAVTTK